MGYEIIHRKGIIMFNGDQSVMDCNLRDYENGNVQSETDRNDALETGYRFDTMKRCADVLADLVLDGKDIEALLKWLHDEAEKVVNGKLEGADEVAQKRGE